MSVGETHILNTHLDCSSNNLYFLGKFFQRKCNKVHVIYLFICLEGGFRFTN